MGDFDGRHILVTGGSRGIGLAVSQALAARGATVTIVARDAEVAHAAQACLAGSGHRVLAFDVSDASAWLAGLERIDAAGALHGLVTAAGVLGPIGDFSDVDIDEFVRTLQINLMGTVLALNFSWPRLMACGGRAVTFSGGGGTGPLPRYDAYAGSKAAIVRLTENIAAGGQVEVNAVAPGFVATQMHEGTLTAGAEAAGDGYFERTREQLASGGVPRELAAELVCFLLSSEAHGITGRLISAQWDPWRKPEFQARLRSDPDLARLRRIDDHFFTSMGG